MYALVMSVYCIDKRRDCPRFHHFPFCKRVLFSAKSLDGLTCFMVKVMRRFFTVLACLTMGLIASGAARGVEVSGLYEAEVPVTGQSAAERIAASRTALEDVLVKVSGRADIANLPQLKPMLSNAQQWVQRYQYRTVPPPVSGTSTADSGAPTQMLWETFDRKTINQRLYDAGVSVWGINRPVTLMWLAIEDGRERYLVGGDNRTEVQTIVNAQARKRGLPLNLPLLDLQDQGALAVADVWGDFSDMIFKASERYQPDAILVGRVYTVAADQWQSRWTLYHRGNVTTWESERGSRDDALTAGISGAAEQFAKRYAFELTPGIANTILMTIENMATLADYARITHYLQSLDPVADVQVARVEDSTVTFRIQVRGQTDGLIQTIALGNTLAALSPQQANDAASLSSSAQDENGGETASPEEFRYRIIP